MTILLLNLSLLYYLTGWKIFKSLGKFFAWLWAIEQVFVIGVLISLLTKLL